VPLERLAYLVSEVVHPRSGVGKKLVAQLEVWSGAGFDTLLAVLCRPGDEEEWDSATRSVVTVAVPTHGSVGRRELARQRAGLDLARAVRRWSPDGLYVRFGPLHVGEELLRRHCPIALEFNSDDLAEYRDRPPLFWYHRATRTRLLGAAAVGFAPTHAIAGAMSPLVPGPVHVITNGVDLRDIPQLPPNQGRPAVGMLAGSDSPRQGVDKALRLAQHLPDVDVHLVGPSSTTPVPTNVYLHGPLPRSAYLEILGRCDIALGTLALHRVGMQEASPLKVREYLALGLPVVLAYSDPDRDAMGDWVLEIPNVEHNVESDVPGIEDFLRRMRGRRVPRSIADTFDQGVREGRRAALLREALEVGPT